MRKMMISLFLFAASSALGNSAYVITVPTCEAGGPVIWLEDNGDFEQLVCVYRYSGSGWILTGTVSSSVDDPGVLSIPCETSSCRYLVWILHRESAGDQPLPWLNSTVTVLKYGENALSDPSEELFRKMTVVIGAEDGIDDDYDDGVVHFTWSSPDNQVFLDFNPVHLPDGFIEPPGSLGEL